MTILSVYLIILSMIASEVFFEKHLYRIIAPLCIILLETINREFFDINFFNQFSKLEPTVFYGMSLIILYYYFDRTFSNKQNCFWPKASLLLPLVACFNDVLVISVGMLLYFVTKKNGNSIQTILSILLFSIALNDGVMKSVYDGTTFIYGLLVLLIAVLYALSSRFFLENNNKVADYYFFIISAGFAFGKEEFGVIYNGISFNLILCFIALFLTIFKDRSLRGASVIFLVGCFISSNIENNYLAIILLFIYWNILSTNTISIFKEKKELLHFLRPVYLLGLTLFMVVFIKMKASGFEILILSILLCLVVIRENIQKLAYKPSICLKDITVIFLAIVGTGTLLL